MIDVTTSTLSMDRPAIYRISVRGRLDPQWSAGLVDLNLSEETLPDGTPNTVLVGRMADQAALSGLLNSLYELHLPIVSVECLTAES